MEQLLARSIESMPRAGYWMTDADGVITRSRGQALALSGLTPQQVEGTSVLERVDRDGAEVYRWGEDAVRLYRSAMQHGSGMQHVHEPAGREVWQAWCALYTDGPTPAGLGVVYMDVTGMRDSELTAVIRELTVMAPDIQDLAREKAREKRLANEAAERDAAGRERWWHWTTTTTTTVGQWVGRHAGTPLERLLWLLAGVVALALAARFGVDVAALFKLIQPSTAGGQLP